MERCAKLCMVLRVTLFSDQEVLRHVTLSCHLLTYGARWCSRLGLLRREGDSARFCFAFKHHDFWMEKLKDMIIRVNMPAHVPWRKGHKQRDFELLLACIEEEYVCRQSRRIIFKDKEETARVT